MYRIKVQKDYCKDEILSLINKFDISGEVVDKGKRNEIKFFSGNGVNYNVKSFKKPFFFNKIIYAVFRKSKALRSFEFAEILLKKGLNTPNPIASVENYDLLGLSHSYYVSEHLYYDFLFRDLVETENYPDLTNILLQFTNFCYTLHEEGIEFLDHSPGNTLIKKSSEGKYEFFLVDLNRMNFHKKMSFDKRIKNLSKLVTRTDMVITISREYAKLYNKSFEETFEKLVFYMTSYNKKQVRKRKIKLFFKKA
ncbi:MULTISPECIES: Kdo domain containing protein [unclassified Flavobacterium]|uniref:Kdo domain containing protein n=1 Tax=unclassified Flavobacterium TaxID=196869 RepID=UPI00131B76FB|nr:MULTISPECIES: Kdo domain containing protein [unclassified Flavobacterium]